MEKTSHRPSKTVKWEIPTKMKILISKEDTVDYITVKQNRSTITRTTRPGQKATVILGHKEGPEITVTPEDTVFTCVFGSSGHLSRLPDNVIGKEVTIIYKQ